MRLENKVIIVTGSSTGIGKAMALRFAAEGARIVVHGRRREVAQQVADEIGAGRAVVHIDEISAEGAAQRLVNAAVQAFGRLDGVVNNAARVEQCNIHTCSAAFFMDTLAANTLAPFLLIQAALPHLEKTRGSVLNIGSTNAYCGEPNLLAYSVSKGGLMTLTRNLGDTLMRENGVRVNQLNPGWVLTENETQRKREHGLSHDWHKSLPRTLAPAGRILLPEEIAAAAVYWLSDESGPVSGQVVEIEQYPVIGRNPPKDAGTIPG